MAALFTGYIEALEGREPHPAARLQDQVLVASLESEHSLSIVEKVAVGMYALCKLKPSVRPSELRASSASLVREARSIVLPREEAQGGAPWWQAAAVHCGAPDGDFQRKRRRLNDIDNVHFSMRCPSYALQDTAITSSQRLENVAKQVSPVSTSPKLDEEPASTVNHSSNEMSIMPAVAEPDALYVLDMVRKQYLEALYISRVCVPPQSLSPLQCP